MSIDCQDNIMRYVPDSFSSSLQEEKKKKNNKKNQNPPTLWDNYQSSYISKSSGSVQNWTAFIEKLHRFNI